MAVTTVTLSPAFDRTYFVDDFKSGEVNRAENIKVNLGGKGINFSVAMAKCAVPCRGTGFLGEGREKFVDFLQNEGVLCDFVNTSGEIRTNIKICDIKNAVYTDVNQKSDCVSAFDIEKLFEKVKYLAGKSKFLYMGGSIVPGADADIYREMVKVGRECGCTVVLDASGKSFELALEGKPHIIKPNRDEAAEISGFEIKTDKDGVKAARLLQKMGAECVLLSLGQDGAICACEDNIYKVYPLKTEVKSTVGAGDSFLAGVICGLYKGEDIKNALCYGTSFATAKISREGTDIPPYEILASYISDVRCEQI